jgi:hypothetical protein
MSYTHWAALPPPAAAYTAYKLYFFKMPSDKGYKKSMWRQRMYKKRCALEIYPPQPLCTGHTRGATFSSRGGGGAGFWLMPPVTRDLTPLPL